MTDFSAMRVEIRRVRPNVIEYSITSPSLSLDYPGVQVRTLHANREATFFGPHTGAPARQIGGGARSLWREKDAALLAVFHQRYPNARIALHNEEEVQ